MEDKGFGHHHPHGGVLWSSPSVFLSLWKAHLSFSGGKKVNTDKDNLCLTFDLLLKFALIISMYFRILSLIIHRVAGGAR